MTWLYSARTVASTRLTIYCRECEFQASPVHISSSLVVVCVFFCRFQCWNRGTNHHNNRMSVWIIYYLIYSKRSETLMEFVEFIFERARKSDDDRYLIVAWLDSTRCLVRYSTFIFVASASGNCTFIVRFLRTNRRKRDKYEIASKSGYLVFISILFLVVFALPRHRKPKVEVAEEMIIKIHMGFISYRSSRENCVENGHKRNVRVAIQQWKWPMWMTA